MERQYNKANTGKKGGGRAMFNKMRGIFDGKEKGGILLGLLIATTIVSVVAIVAATVAAGGEASDSSSATHQVVDQWNDPHAGDTFDRAQRATGPSQAAQAGYIGQAAVNAQTINSGGDVGTGMSLGQMAVQEVEDGIQGTTNHEPTVTVDDLNAHTTATCTDSGDSGSGGGSGGSGGGCSDGCGR